MTWMWARFFKRTPKLIYPDGGFQTLTDAMVWGARAHGATLRLSTPVRALRPEGEHDDVERFDRVVVTTSPALLSRLVPSLPASYLAALRELSHMGAVVLTVALKHQLLERSYWLNLDKRETPMLSLVEHTNMVSPAHYGGDRLVYLGDYLPPDHPYLGYDAETLFEVYEPVLRRFNPSYERAWVRDMWLFSTSYAQPVPTLHQARRIPALKTPLDGLYFASMSQVYPWDRGTNYAVELGERVAKALLAEEEPRAGVKVPGERAVNAV
jgi:protoporphyrinogen oxidase